MCFDADDEFLGFAHVIPGELGYLRSIFGAGALPTLGWLKSLVDEQVALATLRCFRTSSFFLQQPVALLAGLRRSICHLFVMSLFCPLGNNIDTLASLARVPGF